MTTEAKNYLASMVSEATNPQVSELRFDARLGRETLEKFKIPENCLLGALVMSGGFSVASGKLRVLGSPLSEAEGTISIFSINSGNNFDPRSDYLVIAYDIYGNYYAINVGYASCFKPGEIIALFSDGAQWESTADSIEDFLSYCFLGDLTSTFDDFKISDGLIERRAMESWSKVIDYYPPLYAREGSVEKSSVRLVGAQEELGLRISILTAGRA